ncbi:MAG: OmpA/MotB family protein [Planctomycetota bacterium]
MLRAILGGTTRRMALVATAALVAAGGCVMDSVVQEEENEIRAVTRDIEKCETRLRWLGRGIKTLEAKAGPGASAEKKRRFQEALAKSGLRVTSRGPEIVVTLASTVLFGPGEATIQDEAKVPLIDLATAITEAFPGRVVRVEGHTDNTRPRRTRAIYPTNWELSAARSLAVMRFLSEDGGIKKGWVFPAAYGEHRPVASNETAEGRELNRRVDIVILPPVGVERVTTAELDQ